MTTNDHARHLRRTAPHTPGAPPDLRKHHTVAQVAQLAAPTILMQAPDLRKHTLRHCASLRRGAGAAHLLPYDGRRR